MTLTKILDLENDGLNMAVENRYLYCLSKRGICKYSSDDGSMAAQNVIFRKDGKARGFSICDEYILLHDFCDLYILQKSDLNIVEAIRLGTDVSSDLGGVRYSGRKAYIGIRNGRMAVMDADTREIGRFEISDASFWDYCVVENSIYAGTVRGELMEINRESMRVIRKIQLGNKNIYSVVLSDGLIYTVSQDMTIKAVSADSFEIVGVAKKAVGGMARILGVYHEYLVVADTSKIVLWNKKTLQICEQFSFPTGSFNKGALLHGNRLFGSDFHSVYGAVVE